MADGGERARIQKVWKARCSLFTFFFTFTDIAVHHRRSMIIFLDKEMEWLLENKIITTTTNVTSNANIQYSIPNKNVELQHT